MGQGARKRAKIKSANEYQRAVEEVENKNKKKNNFGNNDETPFIAIENLESE